jgi:hypothetical protein
MPLLQVALVAISLLSAPKPAADSTLDALIARVEQGDAAARAKLQPIAWQLIESAAQHQLDAADARLTARVALAMARPISAPEAPRSAREERWRAPAVRALWRALATDSGNVWSAEQLEKITPYPYVWLEPDKELAQLRAAAARNAALPTSLIFARIGLEIEVGSADSARSVLHRLDSSMVGSARWNHLAAAIAFARGDTARGRNDYYVGAAGIRDTVDRRIYTDDLAWIATPAELAAWDSVPMTFGAHRSWLQKFWARRDLEDGRMPGTRLPEQFRRWREVLRKYRWDPGGGVTIGFSDDGGLGGPKPSDKADILNAAFNRWRAFSRIIDDRGSLVLRHGDPTVYPGPLGDSTATQQNLGWMTDSGRLIVGFSRVSSFSERFGMVARNVPQGDRMTMCNFDARFCSAYRLKFLIEDYSKLRIIAEHTDGNTETYHDTLSAVTQAYGIPNGGALIVVAVPAGKLARDPTRRAFAANLRIIVGDSAAGRIVAALDTVRHWHSASPVAPNDWLSAYVTVPAPTGTWDVAITVSDTAKTKGTGERLDGIPVVPFDGKTLRLGDPILGRADAGLVWPHHGIAVPLNPTNAWRTTEPVELTFEADGLVPGRGYTMRFEMWKVQGNPRSPSITVSVNAVADSVHEVVQRELSVRELDPGGYRLVIRLQDPVTKQEVTRERRVAVRR